MKASYFYKALFAFVASWGMCILRYALSFVNTTEPISVNHSYFARVLRFRHAKKGKACRPIYLKDQITPLANEEN